MKKFKVTNHLSLDELKKKMKEAESKESYIRWQVILLASNNIYNAEVIKEVTGTAVTTIYKLIQLYNQKGSDGYEFVGSGGRRRYLLEIEEEEKILKSLSQRSEFGEYINASKIKSELEKLTKCTVTEKYVYDVLHRHNWRKIVPRPQHPKKDALKQDDFKKNSKRIWVKY